MTVLITLTFAGSDTGPFNLYSDVDGYSVAFETGVAKASLLSGYSSTVVPTGTTIIRVTSDSVCTTSVDLPISGLPTTTTTTTTATPTTTTSTTTVTPTTTTTTTQQPGECWEVHNPNPEQSIAINWYDVDGVLHCSAVGPDSTLIFCILAGSGIDPHEDPLNTVDCTGPTASADITPLGTFCYIAGDCDVPATTTTTTTCVPQTWYELNPCLGGALAYTLIFPTLGPGQQYILPGFPNVYYTYDGGSLFDCEQPSGYNASIQIAVGHTGCTP